MPALILDGKALAARVRADLAARIATSERAIRLDAVLMGEDRAAGLYAASQEKTCAEVGIQYQLHRLPAVTGAEGTRQVVQTILTLGASHLVRALMVHLPLPEGVNTERVQSLLAVDKDVEGVNPANIGNVLYGRRSLVPCTALAVLELIEATGVPLRGARCVVVGASNIVGKPVAALLMREEATVISANKHTADLPALARTADVLVAAAGVPGLVTADWVKPGAVVIDVGINRVSGADGKHRTVGDVDRASVEPVAGHLTPVPGGVGPMTVAMLLRNVTEAALREGA